MCVASNVSFQIRLTNNGLLVMKSVDYIWAMDESFFLFLNKMEMFKNIKYGRVLCFFLFPIFLLLFGFAFFLKKMKVTVHPLFLFLSFK